MPQNPLFRNYFGWQITDRTTGTGKQTGAKRDLRKTTKTIAFPYESSKHGLYVIYIMVLVYFNIRF